MTRPVNDVSPERISELFMYAPETGHLFHARNGARADRPYAKGYRCVWISIEGKSRQFCAHRIAFVLMTGRWPIDQIDHINRVRSDNSWSNLREANGAENSRNEGLRANNTSGLRGVGWNKSREKWRANIKVNNKQMYLGSFYTKEAAYEAYKAAALRLHGEFCNVA